MLRLLAAILCTVTALGGTRAATVSPSLDGQKRHTATRTLNPPRIDGKLDDPAWREARPDGRFTQNFPEEGKPPTERTEVRVLYDDRALYIGVRCYDSTPAAI